MRDYLRQIAIGTGAIILGIIIGVAGADFAAAADQAFPKASAEQTFNTDLPSEGLKSATAFVLCDEKPHLVGMVFTYADGTVVRLDADHMHGFKTAYEVFQFGEKAPDTGVFSYGCKQVPQAKAPLPGSGTKNGTEKL
jgi:hypothetical protein